MSLFKPVTIEQSAAKVGIFAPQGAGKTTTAALLAIGFSKSFHAGAPVFMLDTENGSDYLEPIFKVEGVPLLVGKSRAFADMKAGLREAESAKACTYIVDSYTHPWQELTQSFKDKSHRKRLEFHHMDQLKSMWRVWVDLMLNSPLHVIVAGRRGFEWGEQEDGEDGQKLVKLGSKMKGESEAGYEPSLLIEMEAIQDADSRLKKTRAKKGTILHHAYVLKDRWRSLNGRTFQFKDINDYKASDYKKVFDAFQPHWSHLAIGTTQRAVDGGRTSEAMFDDQSEGMFQARARRVGIVLEEFEATLGGKLWPGSDAKSKAMKLAAIEAIFNTRSWKQVESLRLERLEDGLALLRSLEEHLKDCAPIDGPEELTARIAMLCDRMHTQAAEERDAAVL
jgi:hypothetical protein